MQTMGERLREAREAAKFTSAAKAAEALGVSASSYRAHENGQNEFDPETAERYARKFGTTAAYLLTGEGPKKAAPKAPLISSYDESAQAPEEIDPDWQGNGGGYLDGRIQFEGKIEGSSPEFAATPGMGQGQFEDRTARVVSNGIASGHPVVNEWYIPPAYVRNALDATPSQIMILPVIGHSMEPLLKANDRVMVDVSQNTWVGDAVYIIDNGLGVLQAKTVKHVAPSNPPRFRIISEATPDEEPVILSHDEFRIVGRVVGRFTRM